MVTVPFGASLKIVPKSFVPPAKVVPYRFPSVSKGQTRNGLGTVLIVKREDSAKAVVGGEFENCAVAKANAAQLGGAIKIAAGVLYERARGRFWLLTPLKENRLVYARRHDAEDASITKLPP